jgi:ribosomal protein L11 methylase PrmA
MPGCFDIIAEESDISEEDLEDIKSTEKSEIKLIDVGAGWGNGAHPTTKLCMNFIMGKH